MLSSTEFYANTPLLQTVLWIEAVIYLGIGLFEVFDDFFEKPKQWMNVKGRINGWLMFEHKIGHKMHAGICVLLGFVALNGALEGRVTRFELELIFLSFAVIMLVIWSTFMPGRLGFIVVAMKPEFWLQIVMFAFFRSPGSAGDRAGVCGPQPVGRRGVRPAHAEKLLEALHVRNAS